MDADPDLAGYPALAAEMSALLDEEQAELPGEDVTPGEARTGPFVGDHANAHILLWALATTPTNARRRCRAVARATGRMTRVIAGAARGRRLAVPPGTGTRPTSDRAREGLFATVTAVHGPLTGAGVVDLYAGSGAVGLEALSRGAARAAARRGRTPARRG